MKFLRAKWEHLLLANYRVDPGRLEPYVPPHTRLDHFEGHCYVSLVAFMFNQTRVLGVPVPFHTSFEEVNLRFYVRPERDTEIRGVCFIKELVPRAVIPLIANTFFHENYEALPMSHDNTPERHSYRWNSGVENRFEVSTPRDQGLPAEGSIAEFITEHYWGYAAAGARALEYEVEHPQWRSGVADDYCIDVDFKSTYGETFAFLQDLEAHNVLYASGSEVSVSFPRRI